MIFVDFLCVFAMISIIEMRPWQKSDDALVYLGSVVAMIILSWFLIYSVKGGFR